jgi:aminopeptidase N
LSGTNLTREEARSRAELLSVESYALELDLTTGDSHFGTRTTVRFSCRRPGEATFIDLLAESVQSLTLNGAELDPATCFDGSRVQLAALQADNELVVDARGIYMNTGEGLHRFVDPADGEVYLYTQFEVADSRRMFAVFEQPDLKASFAFTVTAPAHWQVVSCSPTPTPTPATGVVDGPPAAVWAFEPTPVIASYITALVAGPYAAVHDQVDSRRGVVPLGIYCRKSLLPYLDAENVFDATKRGFDFFEREFDTAYPFAKYDQLFTPEYNMGAMENAGAVTVNEVYIFRAKVTDSLVERRALTILHELAHMWFGNLVTMRWWNDLWLNESFAEWASTTCQTEATKWETAWTTFCTSEKAWAYRQDQLSSTHPIVADIRDLQDVEVNFDGITYAKGASVLKQLVAYVGREPFTAGLRRYFSAHAWGNTALADLLVELEATSGRDLSAWSSAWLETAGVNTLRPLLEVADDGTIAALAIEQSADAAFPTLRPHRLAIGTYDLQDGQLIRSRRIEVDVDGRTTAVPELTGAKAPDLLLVNDDDLAYAKIRLDPRSLATAVAHPRGFDDSLPRALVLGAAWDMTRDAEMAGRDFVELALRSLPGESDSTLLRILIGQIQSTALLYVAPDHRAALTAEIATRLRGLLAAAEPGSDAQLQLATAFAGLARSDEHLAYLSGLLDGSTVLVGLAVDREMRWTLLTSLVTAGAAGVADVQEEHDRDRTATGRERAARALAAIPTAERKSTAWTEAVDSEGLPTAVIEATGIGFGSVHDPELLRPYVERYHAMLDDVWSSRTHAIGEAIVAGFYPTRLADQSLLRASQTWLDEHPNSPPALRRLVAENRDAVSRALAAQARDAART